MKTARFLLACAVASVLAACGTQSITSSDARAPKTPNADETTSSTPCVIKSVVLSDGSTVEVCVSDGSSQIGSGN